MGNIDSRLSFYKDMLLRLANEEVIPLYDSSTSPQTLVNKSDANVENTRVHQCMFDSFYTSLISFELPHQYLSAYLTTNELRLILTQNKTNFTNLVRFLSFTIIQTDTKSLKNPTNRRMLINSIGILIKLMPILYETNTEGILEAEIFWSKNSGCSRCIPKSLELDLSQASSSSAVKAATSPSLVTSSIFEDHSRPSIDTKFNPQDSLRVTVTDLVETSEPALLGQQLVDCLIKLGTIEGLTLSDDISIHSNHASSANMFFLSFLQLFTTLFSKPLYKSEGENRFLRCVLVENSCIFEFNEMVSRLLKIVVRFDPRDDDPVGKAIFLASLQFFNITMRFSSDHEHLIFLYFQKIRASAISNDIYQPLYEILSIIMETEDSSNFVFSLPIYQFISNLLKITNTICTQITSQFGHKLFTISLIYCKAVSQDRTFAPLQQFLAYFITFLSSLPQIYSNLSSGLKSCELTFLPDKVRNQQISIREFCIMQLSRHVIPILKSQDTIIDPCYLETLYNLIRIPSSLNYSACMSIQSLLATFHESIQLPVINSPSYSKSLSFKLDLLALLIHALVANILENYQFNKVLLFVLCRNEHVLQQLLQLIEDLSQDSSRNRPLAPSITSEEPEFRLPLFSGHKALIEHLDFDYRPFDHDMTLLALRPTWPLGMSIRSKQKLRIDSELSKTWLGKKYAYALIKVVQIVNSEFPSIMKITKKEDLRRLLLHLKVFEPSLLKLAKPIIPLSLSHRTLPSCIYLSYNTDSDKQNRLVNSWFNYILWSDIFNSCSGKVYLPESDNDTGSISGQGNPNNNSPNNNTTNNTITSTTHTNNHNNNTAPGTPTIGPRSGNRLERFNSNGSVLSRTNTNDDLRPKTTPEVTSTPWFRIPWSNEDDTSFFSSNGGDIVEGKKSIKPNIWTGTYVRLFPLVVEPCESEFSIVDMTSSLLRKFRFNSTTSINSMDTMHTISNYT